MTREEAIEVLKEYEDGIDLEYATPFDKAILYAIKALSQEPCDDTVSIRKDVLKCRVGKLVVYNVEWLKKHWQMEMDIVCGVKPCDDAISREAVLNILQSYVFEEDEIESVTDECQNNMAESIARNIVQLPSVTQKSGKWILTIEDWNKWTCSNCGYVKRTDIHVNIGWNYCPNCGAKMESEDKE